MQAGDKFSKRTIICKSRAVSVLQRLTQTESRWTYRVDNALECVEAIFDRKHMVLAVRNVGELRVRRRSGVNVERRRFNAAFPLYD